MRWSMGHSPDGVDSIASQVVDELHWPDMRVLIVVANSAQKETSSTDGMQRSVLTSPLLTHRAQAIVEPRMREMEAALQAKDFPTFARLTMQDSNQFHATCLDTFPPIFYLNDTSKHVIHVIHAINALQSTPVAAYTFDAGPNAVIYCLQPHMEGLLTLLRSLYGKGRAGEEWMYDPMKLSDGRGFGEVNAAWASAVGEVKETVKVHQIIVSRVGEGAQITGREHSFH